jgi:hypothetical protein
MIRAEVDHSVEGRELTCNEVFHIRISFIWLNSPPELFSRLRHSALGQSHPGNSLRRPFYHPTYDKPCHTPEDF